MADEAVPAQQAPVDNTTNVVSSTGELVSVPNEQLQAALHPVNGYRVATPDDVSNYEKEQKYGGATGALKAAGNEALNTATFGLVPGIGSPEDIKGYSEQHPIAAVAGSTLPFLAENLIPGVGEAADASLLQKAGRAVTENVPGSGAALKAVTAVPRAISAAGHAVADYSGLTGVGAKALQFAAEGAIMQGGNEVSKMLLKEPDSAGQAVLNEGLAALFGGALGATAGGIGKLGNLMETKFPVEEAEQAIAGTDITTAKLRSGIELPESLHAPLSGDLDSVSKFQTIQKSDAWAGRQLQKDVSSLYDQAEERTLEALGADPAHVESAPNKYDYGSKAIDLLESRVKAGQAQYGPAYDAIQKQTQKAVISPDQKAGLVAKLTKAISDAGLGSLEGSAEQAQINNLYRSIDSKANANDIKNLVSGIYNSAKNPELQRFQAVVTPVLKDFQNEVLTHYLEQVAAGSAPSQLMKSARATQRALKANSPEAAIQAAASLEESMGKYGTAMSADAEKAQNLLQEMKKTNALYASEAGIMKDVGQSVGVGRFKGTNSFLRALKEKPPEQIIERLANRNRQDLTELMQKEFPELANLVKEYQVNEMLNKAKFKEGGLDTKKLLNNLFDEKQNPRHIQDAVMGIAKDRLSSIKDILNAVPKDGNPSNSASMLNRLWSTKLGSMAGAVSGFISHGIGGGAVGSAIGSALEKGASEINPFISYKILESRAAGKAISGGKLKAMYDYARSVALGHEAINKGVNGLINQTSIMKQSHVPSESDKAKLDKHLEKFRENPDSIQYVAKDLQDTMPEHVGSLSMIATGAANYLNSIKPQPPMKLPQDGKAPISTSQKYQYGRQLAIAQQPLMVLQHIKNGDLTGTDIATLKNCHPAVFNKLVQEISSKMTDPDLRIPYRIRLGMTQLIGQPLDSTMTQPSIMAAQPVQGPAPASGPGSYNGNRGSTKALGKLSSSYETPLQTRAQDALKH